MNINTTLANIYRKNAENLGITFKPIEQELSTFMGSSDMGNVSYVVPSIHPFYSIDTNAANHSHGFAVAAATDIAHQKTLIAAKAMAMAAIDVMSYEETLELVKKEFKESFN